MEKRKGPIPWSGFKLVNETGNVPPTSSAPAPPPHVPTSVSGISSIPSIPGISGISGISTMPVMSGIPAMSGPLFQRKPYDIDGIGSSPVVSSTPQPSSSGTLLPPSFSQPEPSWDAGLVKRMGPWSAPIRPPPVQRFSSCATRAGTEHALLMLSSTKATEKARPVLTDEQKVALAEVNAYAKRNWKIDCSTCRAFQEYVFKSDTDTLMRWNMGSDERRKVQAKIRQFIKRKGRDMGLDPSDYRCSGHCSKKTRSRCTPMEDISSEWYCAITHAMRMGMEPEDMKKLIEEHWIPKEKKEDDSHDGTEMAEES